MMTDRRRIGWILVLVVMIPGLASAMRRGRLIGRVVDTEGHPIPGVTVTTTSPDIAGFTEVATTDEKGLFKVDFGRLHVAYQHRFEKPGYRTLIISQTWTIEGTKRHEFTLQPGQPATLDGQPPASTSNEAILAFNEGIRDFQDEDYPTARTKLEEALGHDPELRQAWEVLSVLRLRQKDYREAAEAAEKAIALGSTDESVLRSRWEAYRSLGDEARTAEAQADLERVGRLTEEAKRIHNEGVNLSKTGDEEGAYARFQEALALDPNLREARLGLATASLKTGRDEEAAAAAEALLAEDPQNEQALRIRYNAALKLGNEDLLIQSLVGLAAVDPSVARQNLMRLAQSAYDSDATARAKRALAAVLELEPDQPRAHYLLGLILMREGANAESRTHLQRFLELAPDDPDAATAEKALEYLAGR